MLQKETTHQGLERVFMIYGFLSGVARRIAGSLAITQKGH
jgi:hypothetical protein